MLDIFGGTGCVSYMLKMHGKQVTYNDYLKFNYLMGLALVENSNVKLLEENLDFLTKRHPALSYENFVTTTFQDIYFTDEENAWLDIVCQNLHHVTDKYKQALAYYSLFQSCIIKRPYNLFHRKNLYMRMANVQRGFGNKATWDTPFEDHFRNFAHEANDAVFDSGIPCRAVCYDAFTVPGKYDLVYIDPPYLNKSGIGVDYLHFYHFLEGLTEYSRWANKIDYGKKHRPLKGPVSPWSDPKQTREAFSKLLRLHADSILVVSYRSDGIPSERELTDAMKAVKREVRCVYFGEYKYALSTNGESKEMLLIGV